MRLSHLVSASLIGALMFFVGVTPATAQRGRIQGQVEDQSGAPLAGAQIATEGEGNTPKQTETDDDGRYSIIGFASGRVTVIASLEGYGPESFTISVIRYVPPISMPTARTLLAISTEMPKTISTL